MVLLKSDTILDILRYRAQYQSDKLAYIFLQDGETESGCLTYGELDRCAIWIASHLQSMQGERALLLYPPGLEFITAFFGCLYAGIVPVPAYPPRLNQKLSRLLCIVNDAQAKLALTTTSMLFEIEKRWLDEPELMPVKLVATDTLDIPKPEFIPQSVTAESLAFLQYTSGSTGRPKGVMVTHGNIIHNQQLIQQSFGHSEQSIGVGWLPLFHDMGLIGHVLQPIYVGFPSILMPPVAFIQKPIRWLQAISKYRATTSGGPNFAYDLCVKKVQPEQLAELDLSSCDLAYIGSEPVQSQTLEQFGEKFANCGFNCRAFFPCYGMAETTLFTTGGAKNQMPVIHRVLARELEQNLSLVSEVSSPEKRAFVGVGRSYMDTIVIIVNPQSLTCCEIGQVGEIWVSGGSIASGYWNNLEATQETFQAYLKDTGEGPFLRTGDLGFCSNGELFVTGRIKDVIIIRGQNHYPQDIELSVQKSHTALRANCGTAFSIEIDGEEKLVVVQEVERAYLRQLTLDEVVEAINQAVSLEQGLAIDTIVLLKPGSIPKTSSGKIQRHACRQKFLDGNLQNVILARSAQKDATQENITLQSSSDILAITADKIEIWIKNWLAKKFEINAQLINTSKSFAAYGLDSMTAVEFIQEIETWLSNFKEIEVNTVWNNQTIESFAFNLAEQLNLFILKSQINSKIQLQFISELKEAFKFKLKQNEMKISLSYSQEWMWIYNHSSMKINVPLRISGSLNIKAFKQSLNEIVRRHDILRTTFPILDGYPAQVISDRMTLTLSIVDLVNYPKNEREAKSLQLASKEIDQPFDLANGPLIRAQLLQLEEEEYLFIFIAHHLVFDGFSIAIFLRELSTLYKAFSVGLPSPLKELPLQYADFANSERQCLKDEVLGNYEHFWRHKLLGFIPTLQFQQVHSLSCSTYSFNLSAHLTKSLEQLSCHENVTLFITMLSAFKVLLYTATDKDNIVIAVTNANRYTSELTKLIGFFANTLLVPTKLSGNLSFRQLLEQVCDIYTNCGEYSILPIQKMYALTVDGKSSISDYSRVAFRFIQIPSDISHPNILQSRLVQIQPIDAGEMNRNLFLSIFHEENGLELKCSLAYTTCLFDINVIEKLVNCYYRILEDVVKYPDKKMSDFELYPYLSEII